MSKGRYLLIVAVLMVVSVLFTVKLVIEGSALFDGIIIGVVAYGIVLGSYKGVTWLKWVGVVYFVLLALVNLFAALESEDYSFLITTCGYIAVVALLFENKRIRNAVVSGAPVAHEAREVPVSKTAQYPLLVGRIKATFIDTMLILIVMIVVMMLTQGNAYASTIRIATLLLCLLLYEPLLSVYDATLGQKLIGIRVRSASDSSQRITLVQSYTRSIMKSLLGWLSFVTIHFNDQRRAIHDFAASSVMIMNDEIKQAKK